MATTISNTGRLSSKDHRTFCLDNPAHKKMFPQEFQDHVIRHGESTTSRTNGGKQLNRSVWFSDKVSVQFVPGMTNRMAIELFYSAEELTKFKDDAVIEESGLLDSVSASAE
jgi:hypothetical protein